MTGRFEPTKREIAHNKRIYGDESNWLGVATRQCKIERAKVLNAQKREKKACQ